LEQYSDDATCNYDTGGDVDVSDSDDGASSTINSIKQGGLRRNSGWCEDGET
jgi:hypothetical protein